MTMNDRPIRDDTVAAEPPPERVPMSPPPEYAPPPEYVPPSAPPEVPIGRAYRPATVAGPAPLALRRDLVRWGPVVAGLVTALTTLILLSLLAVALGITALADGGTPAGSDTFQLGAAVTAAVIGIVSFFIGGLVAARTAAISGRGAGALNGFLVWALGVVVVLALAAMGLSAILGAAGNVVGATGMPQVTPPNVSPGQSAELGRNSALGAFISLAIPAIAAAIGGAFGARAELASDEDVA